MPRLNPTANAGMTNADKWRLEGKAKQGWKCYFIERESTYELQEVRENARETANNLRNNNNAPDYEHLKNMFLALYDKVGELCDCPCCYETMTKDKTFVPMCGHLICNDCKSRVNVCPICRKKY
jgi:hypothetical protein